jgi:hypothetical protein
LNILETTLPLLKGWMVYTFTRSKLCILQQQQQV